MYTYINFTISANVSINSVFYNNYYLGETFSAVGSVVGHLSLASKVGMNRTINRTDYWFIPSQKGKCMILAQSSKTVLCGLPAQERCWPTTCYHLIHYEYVTQ